MKVLCSTFVLCFFCSLLTAQKQGNIWYFGINAGFNFNTGQPTVLMDGQTYGVQPGPHSEGSSSICDSSGALLFYTNGEVIWNKNHQIMPNGGTLMGGVSSTQSSLIVPAIGRNRYFYVFTTDGFYQNNLGYGLRYNVVDICLDSNRGDIIQGAKNILLLDTVAEKLTAVRHSNGRDYWIITHKYYSNTFYAFHLSAGGIVNTVISSVGSFHPTGINSTAGAIGQLKASPNGRKLAVVNGNTNNNIVEYFDFNKSTGMVTNAVDLQWDPLYSCYGVEFSPDNSKLYVAVFMNGNGIYQFDLAAGGGNPASVRASRMQVASGPNYLGLQLAPDGKIYSASSPFVNNFFVHVINNPNGLGGACNFVSNAINLNGRTASYGFPNFIAGFDYSNSSYVCDSFSCNIACSINANQNLFCSGDSAQVCAPPTFATYLWNTGQTTSCINTKLAGNYYVTVTDNTGCTAESNHLAISIYPLPPVSISVNGDTLTIYNAVTQQWYRNGTLINGATTPIYIANQSGIYTVAITDTNGCHAISTPVIISGIDNLTEEDAVSVYPNPSQNSWQLSVGNNMIGGAAEVFDADGRVVFHSLITNHQSLITPEVSRGVYLLRISSAKSSVIRKLIRL